MTEVGTVTAVPYEEHGSPPARKAGTIGVPLLNIIMKVQYLGIGLCCARPVSGSNY